MEVSKSEHHFLVLARLGFTGFVNISSQILESSSHVSLKTLWRLIGELNSTLQDRYWEIGTRGGGEEQSVVGASSSLVLLLLHALEFRHPGDVKMAILEADPVTSTLTFFHHHHSFSILALTERDNLESVSHADSLG